VLLGIIKHSILQIEFYLFAEKDARIEEIFDASGSILLVEVP
jgi:hypothetical protein